MLYIRYGNNFGYINDFTKNNKLKGSDKDEVFLDINKSK